MSGPSLSRAAQCGAALLLVSALVGCTTASNGRIPWNEQGLQEGHEFDSPLQQQSLKLEDRGWFEDGSAGQQTFTLVSRDNLVAGKRTNVEVCFADEAAPACASFELTAHPGLGMQEVKVLWDAARQRTVTLGNVTFPQ